MVNEDGCIGIEVYLFYRLVELYILFCLEDIFFILIVLLVG